jgi:HEAT repeat protein/tetratricopeptide (TPR) repeat protein
VKPPEEGPTPERAEGQGPGPGRHGGAVEDTPERKTGGDEAGGKGPAAPANNPPVVARLIADLNGRDAALRRQAAEQLGKLRDREAVPALVRRVADNVLDDDAEKDAALAALMGLAPDRVPEALGQALKSDSAGVRAWAARQGQGKPDDQGRSVAGTWESNWGPITLQHGPPEGNRAVAVTGSWVPEPGKRGVIRDGTFDPAGGTLEFTFHQPWDGKTGTARLTLSVRDRRFQGTWKAPGDNGTLALAREAEFAQGAGALEGTWTGNREQVNLLRLPRAHLEATTATPREAVGLRALTDGDPATVAVAAAGPDAPLDVVYGFAGDTVTPQKLLVRLPARAPPGAGTASVEVLASTLSPHAGFRALRTLSLRPDPHTQELVVPPAAARWVLLRFRPAEGTPRLAVAEVALLGRNGPPATPYAFKESPARALDLLARLRKVSTLDVSVTEDEADLFADVRDGRFRTWSFAEAALLASGVQDKGKRKAYLGQIDRLEAEARRAVADAGTPPAKGEKLLRWLHAGPLAAGYVAGQTDLPGILDTRTFNCVSSAVLYNVLALRLGLDARAIEVPDHALSIVYDGTAHADVETTTPDGFDPAREPGARRHFTRRTGFTWIPDSHADQRRELREAGLVALVYYNHGVEWTRQKRYHEALLAFFRAMSLDAEFASAVKNTLAVLANWSAELARGGKYEQALEVLATGLDLAPRDAALSHNRTAVWGMWAEAASRAGKEEALAILTKAAAALPGEADHFQSLEAWVYIRRGEEHVEAGEWEKAAALVPEGMHRLAGRARQELGAWGESVYLRWAQAELRAGRFEAAARAVEHGRAAGPQERRLAGYLGHVLREWLRDTAVRQGDDKAEELLARLEKQYPKAPEVRQAAAGYVLSGALRLLDEGKYEDALGFIDHRAGWLPDKGRELAQAVYDRWAQERSRKGDWAGAAGVYARALRRYPRDGHLENNALATYDSWAQGALDAGRLSDALDVYARALERFPASSHVQNNLAYTILRLVKDTSDKKGPAEGKKQLAQLQERFGLKDLGEGFVLRALDDLTRGGRYEEAAAFLDKSADLIPDKAKVRDLYLEVYGLWARKYEEAKDPAGVVGVYERAVRRWPEEAALRVRYARAAQAASKAIDPPLLVQRFPHLVESLTKALTDREAGARGPAADALGRLGGAAAVPALERRVADDLWYVSGYSNVPDDPEGGGKAAALGALRALAPERVQDALVAAAGSKTVEVRAWALACLGELVGRGDDPGVVAALVRGLSEPDPTDKDHAARMVRKGGHIRAVAAEALRKLGARSAVPDLTKRVADGVWYASGYGNVPGDPEAGGKAAALKALAELAPGEVIGALTQATRSKVPEVQLWALALLKEKAPDRLTAALLEAVKSPGLRVKVWALHELAQNKANAGNEAVVAALTRALQEKDSGGGDELVRLVLQGKHPRKVAAEALRELGAKSAVPALRDRVADDRWYTSGYSNVPDDPQGGGKAAALAALRELAPEQAAPALEKAKQSNVPQVRDWADKELKAAGEKKKG